MTRRFTGGDMGINIIESDSLEIFKQNIYSPFDIGRVSDNCYLSIVTTNKCQKNCFYCINSETDRMSELPIEKCVKNIKKLVKRYKVKQGIFLGGEPLLHSDIINLIKKVRLNSGLEHLMLTTNGIKLKNNKDFIKKIIDKENGIQGINISFHNEDFIKLNELKWIYNTIKKLNCDIKVRINTNVWRGNNDTLKSLLKIIETVSFADEIRVSNLIYKDAFSVNSINNNLEKDKLILSDKEYINLFNNLVNYYSEDYTIINNDKTLGFVRYLLIPTKFPIIINWNINSHVSDQICENPDARDINTFKCLVNGDISLSWNRKNIVII